MVKGSFQTDINGDLKLTGQQNVAKPTKEFAFLGSTPDSVILMLCQQLLSLTSDSAQAEQDPLQKKKIFPCPTSLASSEPLERLKYLPMPEKSCPLEYRTTLQSLGTMIWHWNKLCPGEISWKMVQSIIRIGLGRLHRAKQDTTNWWMRPRRISAPCNVFCCCCCLLVST